jgi:hypothetical protein
MKGGYMLDWAIALLLAVVVCFFVVMLAYHALPILMILLA